MALFHGLVSAGNVGRAERRTWCTSSPSPWKTCTTGRFASSRSRRTSSATAARGSEASLALSRNVPTAGELACRSDDKYCLSFNLENHFLIPCDSNFEQVRIQQLGPGMMQQIQSMCGECHGEGERVDPKLRWISATQPSSKSSQQYLGLFA